jgi:hypothetical protein
LPKNPSIDSIPKHGFWVGREGAVPGLLSGLLPPQAEQQRIHLLTSDGRSKTETVSGFARDSTSTLAYHLNEPSTTATVSGLTRSWMSPLATVSVSQGTANIGLEPA